VSGEFLILYVGAGCCSIFSLIINGATDAEVDAAVEIRELIRAAAH
jgi:hypothetical protein